jgi:hypothetical protein
MGTRIVLVLMLLAEMNPILANLTEPGKVDENSIAEVIKKTREMYESGGDKREIAQWITGVVDRRIISSNSSEALRRPIWASLQVEWVRNDPSNSGEYFDIANSSWSRGYGNCEENSAIAYYILKKAGVRENLRVLRTKAHSFCVWDMPSNALTSDPTTWGHALIVDPWSGEVLNGPEARNNKWFQNGDPKKTINDATRDIDFEAEDWRLIQKREEHRTGEKIEEKGQPLSIGDCFIATAVYGTPLNNEIKYLRSFRDNKLRKHLPGRIFISFYERFGPFAAFYIRQNEQRKQWALQHIVTPALNYVKQENKQP